MEIEELKQELKNYLKNDETRYNHSIGVMNMCEKLAIHYNCDIERTKKAGLMHDLAKYLTDEEKIAYVDNNSISITETQRKIPGVLHGIIAADICKNKYGFDEEMCSAIAFHTTGKANMTLLEKIVFVADKIEENRDYSDIEYYRNLAMTDITQACLEIVNFQIQDAIKKDKIFDKKSIETRNFILLNRKK